MPSRVWEELLEEASAKEQAAKANWKAAKAERIDVIEGANTYGGISEYDIADRIGYARCTIRVWRGKREA